MALRTDLQTKLEALLGSTNVYFQPPPNIQMVYPCIVYKLSGIETEHADNAPYKIGSEYSVTVIDRNPDSAIPYEVAQLKSCSFSARFPSDGLNHTVFKLYF